jgi:thiol:disulfide interchange protein DsbD
VAAFITRKKSLLIFACAFLAALAVMMFALLTLLGATPLRAQEFLDPLTAFQPAARALDDQTLEVRFEIAPGYYLYRDKFRFAADDITLGSPEFPQGREKEDDTFGKVEVFYETVIIRLPVERNLSGPMRFSLRVTSQGCADAGLCYPPQTQTLTVELPAEGAILADTASADAGGDESGLIAAALKNSGFWANLAFFFVAGLFLAFTPCVLPMIPILSGIIVGQKPPASRRRGFLLSLAYVLGMALTYAVAGVIAGLTGSLFSAALQNVWTLSAFAGIFVLLSLSMFGFYDLQLPSALQSRLFQESGQIGDRLGGIRLLAVFLMGALSALIVGPCVAAPLAGLLLYISTTGDAFLGGAALFVMALGMGAPLLLVGLSIGALPRSGPWMEGIKKGFGVILLATAVWLVSPVIPVLAQMLAYALILMISAIYLRALDPLPSHARGWPRFWKGVGIVMLLMGAALFIGALGGSRDPLQPLAVFKAQSSNASLPDAAPLPFERIAHLDDLKTRLAVAAQAGQPALLDFYADWCVSCKEMERFTFADPAIRERMGRFARLQADVTANSEADKALLRRFQLFGPPGIIFFDANGQEIPGLRVVGFQNAEAFGRVLEQALSLQ